MNERNYPSATTYTTSGTQVNHDEPDSTVPVLDDEPAHPAQPDCDLPGDARGAE